MAISRNNALTKGASGMFGGVIVFKTWNGKTYMSNRPKKPSRESALQKDNRTKFRRATLFAKQMMKDPLRKAEYKIKARQYNLTNAYTAAVTEYMRTPEDAPANPLFLSKSAEESSARNITSEIAGMKKTKVSDIEKGSRSLLQECCSLNVSGAKNETGPPLPYYKGKLTGVGDFLPDFK